MSHFLKACACLIAVLPIAASADDPAPLASLHDLRSLSQDDARRSLPLRVAGVVTFAEPKWKMLFIQEGSSSAFVELDSETTLPDSISAGDRIEIVGSTLAGRFKPKIHADEVVHQGQGELPSPILLTKLDAVKPEDWNRFVVFDGTIYEFRRGGGYVYLHVAGPELSVYVEVRCQDPLAVNEDWLGEAVRIRGALAVSSGKGAPPTIKTNLTQIQFHRSPEVRQTELPYRRLGDLRVKTNSNGKSREPFRVIAQAISDSRASDLVLRDRTGSVLVTAESLPEIRVGDVVVATGPVVDQRGNRISVLSGNVRRVGPGKPIEPVKVTAGKASDCPFDFVSVTAAFRGFAKPNGKRIPVLRDEEGIFTVSGPPDTLGIFDDLSDRSTLRLVGVCWPKVGDAYDFELIADHIDVLYEPPKPPTEAEVLSLVATTRPGSQQSRPELPPGPGSIGPMIVTGVVLLLMLVLLAAFLVVLRRTREQRKFYETIHEQLNEVSHVSRLNTLAEMVGALAHELNQPLASVTNFAETARLLSAQSETPHPHLENLLKRVSSESLRAGEIIRRLRSLASRKTPGQVPTSLNQVVNDSLDMFRMQELVANGTLETNLEEDLPRIEVDPIQLQQVILNLLLNARDATTQLEGRLPKIIVSTRREGDWLTVNVEDNGSGIASSDPSTVFEPYFTTKSEGMGLGLAICRTIVESHNGKLSAENLDPHGARLSVRLPVSVPQGLSVAAGNAA